MTASDTPQRRRPRPKSGKQSVSNGEIIQAETPGDVAALAASLFDEIASRAIGKRGVFRAALAGGTTPLAMYRLIAERRLDLDWQHVHLFLSDERCAPDGSADRNDRAVREALV